MIIEKLHKSYNNRNIRIIIETFDYIFFKHYLIKLNVFRSNIRPFFDNKMS